MNKDWKRVKIKEIGEVVGGATPSCYDSSNYDNGNIGWITPKDLTSFNCRFISNGERNITEKGFKSCSTRLLPKNSILFSSRAPIGYIAIAKNELCTNQGFKSIVPNMNKIDYLFLYYLLIINKDKIEQAAGGTTFKEVSGTTMREIDIEIPPLPIQKKIASILDAIDSKIELNNKINDNLEKQLQLLYNYYFLQFDFPDENGKPYKSSGGKMIYNELLKRDIPYGWEVNKLGNIITENIKSTYQVNQIEDGSGEIPFFTSGSKVLYSSIKITDGKNIFLSTGGKADVKYYDGEAAYSTDTWCLQAQNEMITYIYCFLNSILLSIDDKFFHGSGLKHFQKDLFKNELIVKPPYEVINRFNKLAIPYTRLFSNNQRENKSLSLYRDFLLPLLMNGQLEIK